MSNNGGKYLDVVRFEVDSNGKRISTKKHGYMFYIKRFECDEVILHRKKEAHI